MRVMIACVELKSGICRLQRRELHSHASYRYAAAAAAAAANPFRSNSTVHRSQINAYTWDQSCV